MFAERRVLPVYVESNFRLNLNPPADPYEHIDLNGSAIGTIGQPIILFETYDPDQAWLPFMSGVILAHPPDATRPTDGLKRYFYDLRETFQQDQRRRFWAWRRTNLSEWTKTWATDMIRPSRECDYPYVWDRLGSRHQYLLPFHEYRLVRDASEYRNAKPLWDHQRVMGPDRVPEDPLEECEPYRFTFCDAPISVIKQWLDLRIVGRYYIVDSERERGVRVWFERHSDWVYVRLRCHEERTNYDELREDLTKEQA